MATPLAACSFNFCRLVPRGRSCVVHAVLGDGRGCMSLVSLRKSNYMFDMHTHQIPPGCGLLGRTGPRRRPSGGFRPHARQHTCTHNTGDPRAYYTSKYARTRARCTCPAAAHALASSAAGPATSCPPAARSTAASRRVAPAVRRRHRAPAPLSPPREAARLPPLPPLPPSCSALRLRWPLPPTRNL